MGTAYTPGLTISSDAIVKKVRRLPLKGDVLVQVGDAVEPTDIIARTELPGPVVTVRVAERLGIEANELPKFLLKRTGERLKLGEVIAQRRSLFGLMSTRVTSPANGTIEFISETTGNIGIRHLPTPVEVSAYLKGLTVEVLPQEGAIVATRGVFVQGIFGIGGERHGVICDICGAPDKVVPDARLTDEHKGKVLIAGALAHWKLLEASKRLGATALITGGVLDTDIKQLLGYDIGVAITGDEPIAFTLIVTEGFGQLPIAKRTYELLSSQVGKSASVCGATQIRAGVIRPEVIIPKAEALTMDDLNEPQKEPLEVGELKINTPIRLIRSPYFGALAHVVELPPQPCDIETEAKTRILVAKLTDGEKVIIPRANVEIFSHGE